MDDRTLSEHFEPISNRFLDPKFVYIVRESIALFSVWTLFYQEKAMIHDGGKN